MIRRALLLAPMLLVLWAGIASAQVPGPDGYPPTILPTSLVPVRPGAPETLSPRVAAAAAGQSRVGGEDLARTGSNNVVPLVQAAIVLVGTGALLVLLARRPQRPPLPSRRRQRRGEFGYSSPGRRRRPAPRPVRSR